ncbi:hypothetical protein, partial [Brevibacillus agri]|uniref:hypothetical protein n=1 Tax=Brevibacillus agri TaxID=51101 RepID=UPI002867C6EC
HSKTQHTGGAFFFQSSNFFITGMAPHVDIHVRHPFLDAKKHGERPVRGDAIRAKACSIQAHETDCLTNQNQAARSFGGTYAS